MWKLGGLDACRVRPPTSELGSALDIALGRGPTAPVPAHFGSGPVPGPVRCRKHRQMLGAKGAPHQFFRGELARTSLSACFSASFPSWTSPVRVRSPALHDDVVESAFAKPGFPSWTRAFAFGPTVREARLVAASAHRRASRQLVLDRWKRANVAIDRAQIVVRHASGRAPRHERCRLSPWGITPVRIVRTKSASLQRPSRGARPPRLDDLMAVIDVISAKGHPGAAHAHGHRPAWRRRTRRTATMRSHPEQRHTRPGTRRATLYALT